MSKTEDYRSGALSSMLLGTKAKGSVKDAPPTPKPGVSGAEQPSDTTSSAPSASSTTKKKKSKKSKKSSDGAENGAVTTPPAAAAAAAAPGPEEESGPGLASLFSDNNLKKFKRLERADKDADAAEVRFVSILVL